ncbi:MAG: DUF1223 domain-containing protein, partial [Candidatus Angelobacter sp.]
CSSCPPADELLGRLRNDPGADGMEVIPLGFHVDYWNHLGWQDRFSSPQYSRRQEDYTRKLRLDGPYTPQMIVDGTREFVGSDASAARRAISGAASAPALVQISLLPAEGKLSVKASAEPGISGQLLLAITEDNLSSHVGAGENSGRMLHHSAVVRDFRQIGKLHNGNFQGTVPLRVGSDWKHGDLHVVVFVQDPGTGRIEGAASVAPKF